MIPDPTEFVECDTCRSKTGMAELCLGCLNNRKLISNMKIKAMQTGDRMQLNRINEEIQWHLKQQDVPIKPVNVIQAMFELNYADWICSTSTLPQCGYQS